MAQTKFIPLAKRRDIAEACMSKFLNSTFVLGSYDCAHLVGYARFLAGFDDPTEGKTYVSPRKAMRLLGGKKLGEYLEELGHRPIPISWMLTGDIVGFPSDRPEMGDALGIFLGQGFAMAYCPLTDPKGNDLGVKCIKGVVKGTVTQAWRLIPSNIDTNKSAYKPDRSVAENGANDAPAPAPDDGTHEDD